MSLRCKVNGTTRNYDMQRSMLIALFNFDKPTQSLLQLVPYLPVCAVVSVNGLQIEEMHVFSTMEEADNYVETIICFSNSDEDMMAAIETPAVSTPTPSPAVSTCKPSAGTSDFTTPSKRSADSLTPSNSSVATSSNVSIKREPVSPPQRNEPAKKKLCFATSDAQKFPVSKEGTPSSKPRNGDGQSVSDNTTVVTGKEPIDEEQIDEETCLKLLQQENDFNQ